jgi:phosphoribosylformylglycinamidine cyclo-ligase
VAINRFKVPKEDVLKILAEEWKGQFDMLKNHGISINFSGGETADLPDQLRTLDVSGDIYATYKLDSVITGEDIKPGDAIVGLSSGGQAKYEKKPSGSIMSNGLTLARHCLMKPEFGVKYPEIREPKKKYTGKYAPTDRIPGIEGTIGEELTRPTRVFAPAQKGVIEKFGKGIRGIVFNTGGGNTKCLRVGERIRYIKDNLPDPPAIFKLIQNHGDVSWKEMYKDFNMGNGLELFVDKSISEEVPKFIRREFGIESSVIGECRRAIGQNYVRLETENGNFNYK